MLFRLHTVRRKLTVLVASTLGVVAVVVLVLSWLLHRQLMDEVDNRVDDAKSGFDGGFDVLHRTFLGYPVKLAPPDRVERFHTLFTAVSQRHTGAKQPLTADETAWAAVCTALVQHPEAELY